MLRPDGQRLHRRGQPCPEHAHVLSGSVVVRGAGGPVLYRSPHSSYGRLSAINSGTSPPTVSAMYCVPSYM